jgi:hypothetical protein
MTAPTGINRTHLMRVRLQPTLSPAGQYGVPVSEPTHQLVIQLPENAFPNFDALVSFEDMLIDVLGDRHDVDGHDIGSGEVNFFVFTDNPRVAVFEIREGIGDWLAQHDVRAAARPLDREDYESLWPIGDTRPFTII